VAPNRSIKFDKDGITATSSSTVMKHHSKGLDVKAGQVKLCANDADVIINGNKVLIDA